MGFPYELTWFRIGLPGNSILLAQDRKLMILIARYRKVKRNLSSIAGIDLQIKEFQYETLVNLLKSNDHEI